MATVRARRFSSALVPFVLSMVRKMGKDPAALEKKYLHVRPAEGQPAEVSLKELAGLMEDAAKLTGDPLFGLHCAQAMPRGGYGLLEFALRSAPTARRAVEQLAEYGAVINPLVRWTVEVDGDEVAIVHSPPRKGGVGRQGNTFTVARILQISREMLGPDLRPLRVWFAHDEKRCPDAVRDFLGTEAIAFGRASNGVSFSAADLDRAPVDADPELSRALEQHGTAMVKRCLEDDVLERTRRAVVELLPKGGATLAGAAKRLHVGARTLQRRLADDGVVFADVLGQVRREQAERLLERTDTPLAQVAKQVGYADQAAFARAFKGWTGTSPGKFRDGA